MNESELVARCLTFFTLFFSADFIRLVFGMRNCKRDSLQWYTTLCPFIDKCQSTLMFTENQKKKMRSSRQPFGYFWVYVWLILAFWLNECTQNRRMLIIQFERINPIGASRSSRGNWQKFPKKSVSSRERDLHPIAPFQIKWIKFSACQQNVQFFWQFWHLFVRCSFQHSAHFRNSNIITHSLCEVLNN